MQTTVTLEPDVEALLRKRMRQRGVSFEQALNEALQEGLIIDEDWAPFETPTFAMGGARVSVDRALDPEDSVARARFLATRRSDPDSVSGARLLGLEARNGFEVAERICKGLPAASLERLAAALEMSDTRVLEVLDLQASAHRDRKWRHRRLSLEVSSRVYSVAKTVDAATDFFEGDNSAARQWLLDPKLALDGATPLALARTPEGSDYVIELLGRLERGIVS